MKRGSAELVRIFKYQTCATLLLVTCSGDIPLLKNRCAERSTSFIPSSRTSGSLLIFGTSFFSNVTLPKKILTEKFLSLDFAKTENFPQNQQSHDCGIQRYSKLWQQPAFIQRQPAASQQPPFTQQPAPTRSTPASVSYR